MKMFIGNEIIQLTWIFQKCSVKKTLFVRGCWVDAIIIISLIQCYFRIISSKACLYYIILQIRIQPSKKTSGITYHKNPFSFFYKWCEISIVFKSLAQPKFSKNINHFYKHFISQVSSSKHTVFVPIALKEAVVQCNT